MGERRFVRQVGDETVVVTGRRAFLVGAGAVVVSVPLAHAAAAASGGGPVATVPGDPTDLAGTLVQTQGFLLTLTWDAPTDGAPVTDYDVRQLSSATAAFETGTPLPFTGGPTPGYTGPFQAVLRQQYFFAVKALAGTVPSAGASVATVFANSVGSAAQS